MAKIDKNLIFLYSENARFRVNDLSKFLKKSPQRLKYALSVLKKESIILYPHSIIDYSYFGLILFRIYFKGGYIGEKDRSNIISKLNENNYITSIYELSGEFDLAIEIISPNPSRFNKEFKKIITDLPTLNNYKIILNLVTHIYPRFYMTKNIEFFTQAPHEIIIGGDREVEDFTDKELLVIKSLLINPQIRFTHLAKESNLNIKTAMSIIKNLKKRKIIKGFKCIVSVEKLDLFRFRLFLKLHNLSSEREEELMTYLLKTKEIIQVNKTIGDWDIEIDLETLEKAKVRQMIIELRETFKDIIEGFDNIEFYRYYKKSFLPLYLFEK